MRLSITPRPQLRPRATAKHVAVQQGKGQGQRRVVLQAFTREHYTAAVFK